MHTGKHRGCCATPLSSQGSRQIQRMAILLPSTSQDGSALVSLELALQVEWELWTSSNDGCGPACDSQGMFKRSFRETATLLEKVQHSLRAAPACSSPCMAGLLQGNQPGVSQRLTHPCSRCKPLPATARACSSVAPGSYCHAAGEGLLHKAVLLHMAARAAASCVSCSQTIILLLARADALSIACHSNTCRALAVHLLMAPSCPVQRCTLA